MTRVHSHRGAVLGESALAIAVSLFIVFGAIDLFRLSLRLLLMQRTANAAAYQAMLVVSGENDSEFEDRITDFAISNAAQAGLSLDEEDVTVVSDDTESRGALGQWTRIEIEVDPGFNPVVLFTIGAGGKLKVSANSRRDTVPAV